MSCFMRRCRMNFSKSIEKTRKWLSGNKVGYPLVYTLLFAVVCLVVFFSFMYSGNGFLWIGKGEGASKDGYSQHYTALMYFGQWAREIIRTLFTEHRLEIPMWDFSIGYGSDIVTSMHYYAIGDPLNLISIVVPSEGTETLYSALIIARLYLAGIAFSLFCFKMKKSKTATLAGAFSYILCCYSIFTAVRHPFFINPMIYMPIALIGAEKILRKEKPFIFILSVLICGLSNFYFLYMVSFVVVVYVLIRYFTMEREKSTKDFFANIGKFAGFALIGIGMSAIIFVPVVKVLVFSSRLQETGGFHQILYSASYYHKLLTTAFTSDSAPLWTCTGFTAPTFIAVVVMFLNKKKYKGMKIGLCLFYFMLLFPVFGKLLNGGSYVSNRWTFVVAGLAAYILTSVWEEMSNLSARKLGIVSLAGIVYFSLLIFSTRFVTEETYLSMALIMITIVLLFMKNTESFRMLTKSIVSVAMVILVIFSGCINAHYRFSIAEGGYIEEFLYGGKGFEGIEKSSDKAAAELVSKKKFSRNEQGSTTNLNASVITGATGTQYYWSLENGHISRFYMENGMYSYLSQKYDGNNSRTFIDALAAVKYYIKNNKEQEPYGFREYSEVVLQGESLLDDSDDVAYSVYKNKYPLPLGYTYSSFIDKEDYEKMTPQQKQQAMLQGVVIENTAENEDLRRYKKAEPMYTHTEIKPQIELGKGIVEQEDGSYLVNFPSTITLSFEGLSNCENYLYMEGVKAEEKQLYDLYFDDCQEYYTEENYNNLSYADLYACNDKHKNVVDADMNDKYHFVVASKNTKVHIGHNGDKYRYTNGQEDYLVNLGYSKKALKKMTIKLPVSGVYRFDDFTVVSQPMKQYKENIRTLKKERLVNEKISANTVTGDITLQEDKILCLSIPYSEGWTATVDGVETEILNANTMYMALPLTKGTHKIQLKYTTPLMKESLIITVASSGVFLLLLMWYGMKKKKHNK